MTRPYNLSRSTGERFFGKVDTLPPCWEWLGAKTSAGYGNFTFRLEGIPRWAPAHRWCWEYLVGPVPAGLVLDHLCRNRSCVNPDHLEPVTYAENIQRGWSPQKAKKRCPHGHEYTAENTKAANGGGGRACKACAGYTGRGRAWESTKTHCPQGHAYDDVNTYRDPKTGNRHCRICRRAAVQRQNAKLKAARVNTRAAVAFAAAGGMGIDTSTTLSYASATGTASAFSATSRVITDGTVSGLYAYSGDDRVAAGGAE